MRRAFLKFIVSISRSMYGQMSLVLFGFTLASRYINYNPATWILSATAILSLFYTFFRIYYEQNQLLNPEVDFTCEITEISIIDSMRVFESARRFIPRAKFDLFIKTTMINQRQTETEIRFDIGRIETDLPVDASDENLIHSLNAGIGAKVIHPDRVVLEPNRSSNINMRVSSFLLFSEPEESIRIINKATHFRISISYVQADGGTLCQIREIENPKEIVREKMLKEIENWFDTQSKQNNPADGNEIMKYLRWIFEV